VKSKLHQCTYILLLVSNFYSQVDVEVDLQVYFQRMGTSPLNSIHVGYDPTYWPYTSKVWWQNAFLEVRCTIFQESTVLFAGF
jgi:hypothetical protein